jgi:tetratricopeptide (TPR) repeat protein
MAARISVAVLLVLAVASVSQVCRAQEADRRAEAIARAHYRKAMQLYDLGRFDEAIHELEAAYEYQEDVSYIFNLAQAHRRAGNLGKALELYRTYLRKAPNAPDRTEVERRIAVLESATAQSSPAPDAAPSPRPSIGPRAAEPGSRSVTPVPPPEPEAATATAPSAPPEKGGAPARTNGMLVGGLIVAVGGLLAAGAGVVFALRAKDSSDASAHALVFDPAMEDAARRARTMEYMFLGLGGAAIATGAVLMAIGLGGDGGGAQATVRPSIDGRGALLALTGSF